MPREPPVIKHFLPASRPVETEGCGVENGRDVCLPRAKVCKGGRALKKAASRCICGSCTGIVGEHADVAGGSKLWTKLSQDQT